MASIPQHTVDTFTVGNHIPVLRDHIVHGQHVLPGLAFIDLLFQFFRKRGFDYRKLELRNLSIYSPLIVAAKCQVRLTVECRQSGDDVWQVGIAGIQEGEDSQPLQRFVSAQMRTGRANVFKQTMSVSRLAFDAQAEHVDPIYAANERLGLLHVGSMKPEGHTLTSAEEVTVELRSHSKETHADRRFMFNPMLLDGAAVCAGARLGTNTTAVPEAALYLPWYFESFRASALIQEHCFARLRKSSINYGNDLMSFALDFFDSRGCQIAELKNFTCKAVRSIESMHADAHARFVKEPCSGASAESEASADDVLVGELQALLASHLGVKADDVDPLMGFHEAGLKSAQLLELVGDLGERFGKDFAPTLLFEFGNITRLASHLKNLEIRPATSATTSPSRNVCSNLVPQVAARDIAIVGMAGRFPEAQNVREFWRNLHDGIDCVTEIPSARWDWHQFENLQSPSGKPISRWGGFIADVECFDSEFFRVAPQQAEILDPQERLFLETCWHALEDAGYTPDGLSASDSRRQIGVFAGVMHKDYALLGADAMSTGQVLPIAMSSASIANRVSYFCDFRGPSLTVDTVCSSSLVAVHLAVESIRSGQCEAALAGGVNLSLHPAKYISYGLLDMHSSNGRCSAFGSGGDGYVSSEACGAILLKRLSEALKDGDHVYAVIKGSAANHVGNVSGITVPNAAAQADAIGAALKDASVSARSISYVEAHGTGTSLGDPIEVEGLTAAFRQHTEEGGFCAIGSVKSNIGHAEAAAGITGLIKTALQLEHRTVVASLHAKALNPFIAWEKIPFVVQQETKAWQSQQGIARRAAVSSFGATGTNVHLILEEAPATPSVAAGSSRPTVLPMSAKTVAQLRQYAASILEFVQSTPVSLDSLAYTFQVGRMDLPVRAIFIAERVETLIAHLRLFIERTDESSVETFCLHGAPQDLPDDVQQLIKAWSRGQRVNWSSIYTGPRPTRMSAPVYPFAKEQHWLPKADFAATSRTLHPLVHENRSTLHRTVFATQFSGQETFFLDHRVGSSGVLPGSCHLEIAHFALTRANEAAPTVLREISWISAISCSDNGCELTIDINRERDDLVRFQICSGQPDSDHEIRSEGIASSEPLPPMRRVDLASLRSLEIEAEIHADACYAAFEAAGLHYGASHRGLERVQIVRDPTGPRFVLADVMLSEAAVPRAAEFVLHPCVLDVVLQAAVGWWLDTNDRTKTGSAFIPFALDELRVYQPCPLRAVVLIRRSNSDGDLLKFDFDVCDVTGAVCIELRGMNFRSAVPRQETGVVAPAADLRLQVFEHQWIQSTAQGSTSQDRRRVLCVLDERAFQEAAVASMSEVDGDQLVFVPCPSAFASDSASIEKIKQHFSAAFAEVCDEHGAFDVLYLLCADGQPQALDNHRMILGMLRALTAHASPGLQILLGVSYANDLERCHAEALAGFSVSLGKHVLPGVRVAVVARAVEDRSVPLRIQGWIECLQQGRQSTRDPIIVHTPTGRWASRIIPRKQSLSRLPGFRLHGTYVLSGGLGGLGWLIARRLARKYQATIILIGRSPGNGDTAERLEVLRALGGTPHYIAADVSSKEQLAPLLVSLRRDVGAIHGVLHAAGVAPAASVLDCDDSSFSTTLSPKVAGTLVLDEVTACDEMDFFCLFSSTAAFLGDFGACSYAVANRFQMAFAHLREKRRDAGERHGSTVSIAWPLWADGGISIGDANAVARYLEASGQRALEAEEGLDALETLLREPTVSAVVMAGDEQRIAHLLGLAPDGPVLAATSTGTDAAYVTMLRAIVSETLKLRPERLALEATFESYGADSIALMRMAKALEQAFGPVPKTIFFEHRSIAALASYLNSKGRTVAREGDAGAHEPLNRAVKAAPIHRKRHARVSPREVSSVDAIAIVGMNGRFPGAGNVNDLWHNLRDSVDSITSVPALRWDNSAYFDTRKGAPGKTNSAWGGFIEHADKFDPLFFGIAPRDAMFLDPHERLFLETVWNLLESQGLTRQRLQQHYGGSVGVYVGSMFHQYGSSFSGHSAIANRVSNFFALHGPSVAVDTMCSSAAMALHTACNDLRNGECRLAIVGGVNLSLAPEKYVYLSQAGMLSSALEHRSFGDGDGYHPAEATAAVLLKPLSAALADNDDVLAVIRSTATNHSGRASGYGTPDVQSQVEVMRSTLKRASVSTQSINYVEAAATGSPLGDAMEFAALKQVFHEVGKRIPVGSIKSTLGHAEAASAMTQLIKIILQLRHRTLVPTLVKGSLSPDLDFEHSPLSLQRELTPWNIDREGPRRALINAFGAGGTNVCLLIEESRTQSEDNKNPVLERIFPLSARTLPQLREVARRLHDALSEDALPTLANVAYTLQHGREPMKMRAAIVCSTLDELRCALVAVATAQTSECSLSKIPIFIGETTASAIVSQLTEGVTGAAFVEMMAQEGSLFKIANLWAQGVDIQWGMLPTAESCRMTELPTYPFDLNSFWSSERSIPQVASDAVEATTSSPELSPRLNVRQHIRDFMAYRLGMQSKHLDTEAELQSYGIDSLTFVRLRQSLEESFAVTLPGRELFKRKTIDALAAYVESRIPTVNSGAGGGEKQDSNSIDVDILEQFKAGLIDLKTIESLVAEGKQI